MGYLKFLVLKRKNLIQCSCMLPIQIFNNINFIILIFYNYFKFSDKLLMENFNKLMHAINLGYTADNFMNLNSYQLCILFRGGSNLQFRCRTKLFSYDVELELNRILMFGAKNYKKLSRKNLIRKKKVRI